MSNVLNKIIITGDSDRKLVSFLFYCSDNLCRGTGDRTKAKNMLVSRTPWCFWFWKIENWKRQTKRNEILNLFYKSLKFEIKAVPV